ncbi:MAG: translational GTPase TypA [Candidatus Gracilibacteria bacterium]|nr:translational GTPase TypA [Candidatus Gracilibacteria bacterium]MDD2909024.1 translational GTPase TypA [Candidatus Gracilibacteria bacterium]
MSYRNIAIIAHVDHGKTTLVDTLLKQSGTFNEHEDAGTCIMDSNDQEKERGITIYAKNTAVNYKGEKINIVDTPGHADFGSEVERVLRMVDSVVLVVDAYEGPMPQTKFVLKKALELGIKPLVVINKIDKPTARPNEVIDMLFDLFVQLGATDEQLDFPIVFAIAKQGIAIRNLGDEKVDISPLFEAIIEHVELAKNDTEVPFKMQIANLGYDNFMGRLGIGRVYEGKVKTGQAVTVIGNDGARRNAKIGKVFTTLGLQRVSVDSAEAGDIVTISGIADIYVGETISTDANTESMPPITIDEPTLKMEFLVNDSPFAGKEGKLVTSRNIRDRLAKELEMNVGLKVDLEGSDGNVFMVSGRGELHLSVLIETMRREGFELQVGCPHVIFKEEDGKKLEPMEAVIVIVPESNAGTIIEKLGKRKGIMKDMKTENGITSMEFEVPTRGLLGFRSGFIIDTKGEGIMYSSFSHYEEYKGTIEKRDVGSMISGCPGTTMAYSLWKLEERGPILVDPAVNIYEGMIIGEHLKGGDLTVNPTKNKQLTNIRASGTDEAIRLTPIRKMTLEDALDYIKDDEYVEVTPINIRLRKKWLTENDRKKYSRG